LDVRIFLQGVTYQALVGMLLVNTEYKKELEINTMVKLLGVPGPLTIQSLMVAMVGAGSLWPIIGCEIGTNSTNPN
jgi:hypothetical protein